MKTNGKTKFSFVVLILAIILFSCGEKNPHSSESVDYEKPMSPQDYQKTLGIGFSTDWFKGALLGSESSEDRAPQYTYESLKKTMSDLRQAGFQNLRIRSRAGIWGFASADEKKNSPPPEKIDLGAIKKYLGELDIVLDAAFEEGLYITISWINHGAEGRANEVDGNNFVAWWKAVATHTRNRDYRLSYNLMTEVGRQDSNGDGIHGLFDKPETWNDWTRRAIAAIRDTGGNNAKRNIIITAPRNTQVASLEDIEKDIIKQKNLLLEYHSYAAGPKHIGRNAWNGNGSNEDKTRLTSRLEGLAKFSKRTKIPIYWGAWMGVTNNVKKEEEKLTHDEALAFAEFFATELAKNGIPWSMNKLKAYYDPLTNKWNKVFEKPKGGEVNVEQIIERTVAAHKKASGK